MGSDGLPNGLLNTEGDRINPANQELQQALAGVLLGPYREFEVTARNVNNDPTTVVYRTTVGGATAFTVSIEYDAFYNVNKVSVAV